MPSSSAPTSDPVAATEQWLREFVVRLDLCPFAAAPLRAGRVRISASRGVTAQEMLAELLDEVATLREGVAATTLFVVAGADGRPGLLDDWDEFQDIMAFSEDLLERAGDGEFVQIVGFHPDYIFGDAPLDDPANATNRSPFPMIHLLRRDEVAAAIEEHPDVAGIPERNVNLLRERAERG
ncbi:MAG: DUF1415 domain-containing protein [Deltaproteobacteria bacterium]|nr:DUF1415 domain-containing protein [Deltaproteobacteria bacterium]